MLAATYRGPNRVRVAQKPEPRIEHPNDIVLRVTRTAICGSDLHLLHGRIPGMRPDSPIGHEFVGTITETGPDVKRFKTGDRVVGSFLIACGRCWFCERHEYSNCDQLWVLGYGMFTGDLDGAQAEYVRVPIADLNLHAVDASLSDEQVVFAGDILTTGVYICERAGIKPGDTVAIVGAGPVGLFTLMNARAYAPERIFVVDMAADRLKMAESLGAIPLDSTKVNPVVEIQRATGERGADVVIECVGLAPAFTVALNGVRAGGTCTSVGTARLVASFSMALGDGTQFSAIRAGRRPARASQ